MDDRKGILHLIHKPTVLHWCRCRVPDFGRSQRVWAESARYCTKDAMYNVFESVGEASLEDRTESEGIGGPVCLECEGEEKARKVNRTSL